MAILKDVLYDPSPDGQGSGSSSEGGPPPPENGDGTQDQSAPEDQPEVS